MPALPLRYLFSRFRRSLLIPALAALGAFTADTALAEPIIPGYRDYQTLRADAHALADANEAVSVQSLGTTLGGRRVGVITLAAPGVDHTANPAILILGQEHAPHLLGSELALELAARLADREGLLQRVTFYIIPRPSPDASEAFFIPPYFQRTTNQRPTDDDNDGARNEDGPNDLNNDGYITQLRIADPAGDHTPHPADPRIMIDADADTPADQRYRIITEARDDDGDTRIGEDGPGGVAFDRNFPFDYPFFEDGAGPHQVSEVETRAVAGFAFAHPNIAAVFTFSPRDNLLHAWEANPSAEQQQIKRTLQSQDAPYYQRVAGRYRELVPSENPPPAMAGGGDFVQWAYFHFGRFSFSARAWWPPTTPVNQADAAPPAAGAEPSEEADAEPNGEYAEESEPELHPHSQQLDWFTQQGVEAFVDWQPIDHPDLEGEHVEVGGFKPFFLLNPPADFIDALADDHATFITDLAEMLPRLVLRDVKAERLDDGLVRITARVVNEGALPSVSRMGQINNIPEPVRLTLLLDDDDAELLTGERRITLPPLRGNGGAHEQSWLIRTTADTLELEVIGPAIHGDRTRIDW